ncbi:MAG: reductive dehalogenase [Pseudomonadota bacterium]
MSETLDRPADADEGKDERPPITLFSRTTGRPQAPEPFGGSEAVAIEPDFERFDQSNDMFCRGFWDPKVQTPMARKFFRSFVKPGERARDADGFREQDYAIRNGPWVVTEMLAEMHKTRDRRDGFWDDFSPHIAPKVAPPADPDPKALAGDVKRVAKLYGADLVGVTAYDERWTYASKYSARTNACKPMELPKGLKNVVVIAKSMDYDLIRTSPSATASTAPAIGYTHDAALLLSLAQYIRSLGYQAVACQNDTTLAIPYAIQAGLGELGRNSILITKEYGPRVRLGRVLTDMPLSHDAPKSFGVAKTCEICRRCANNCPPQAIDHGPPTTYTHNVSNIKGVKKWTTDAEKCFKFWTSRGTDCGNCIRTCPYNKAGENWLHDVILRLLGTPFRRFALWLDDRLRLHDQVTPESWWRGDRKRYKTVERAEDHKIDPEKVRQQERVKTIRLGKAKKS